MNEAFFIKNGVKKKIYAQSIPSRKKYIEMYRGYLFCSQPNCTAHLSFAETPDFANKKIFKTAKNSEHSEKCPHKILHDKNGNRYISSETINLALSDKHKHDILRKLYYQNTESATPTINTSPTQKKRAQPTSDANIVFVPKSIASIRPDAIPKEKGMREPTVKKRYSNDILPEDVGKLLGLVGYAKDSFIADDYIEIILESKVKLVFYNSFRDSSSSAFSLVKKIATEIPTNKHDLRICYIGNVEKTADGYQIQITDPSLITFNNESVYNYKIIA